VYVPAGAAAGSGISKPPDACIVPGTPPIVSGIGVADVVTPPGR
jgi:hypothetical protein